jgi:hypothetical protein
LIDGLKPFIQWQSTLEHLEAPPAGYQWPPIDILGRRDEIRANAVSDKYDSEFDFQVDIHNLAVSTHDQHFNLELDAINIFTFVRSEVGPIASVSDDG